VFAERAFVLRGRSLPGLATLGLVGTDLIAQAFFKKGAGAEEMGKPTKIKF